MCGIVFAGSNNMTSRDVEFFEALLYCDIVRGDHSTGVYSGFSGTLPSEPLEVKIRKAAVPADVFIRTPRLWDEVKDSRRPSPNNANATIVKQPKFLVGHNRYATMGEVVDKNAHPFQHGNITLVHNGTLDNQSLLPEHQQFAVDSENIAYSINKIGIEETIQKLHGKFTLVWYDASDKTLNFLRNKDRPFHFIETASGDWFGASEEDMIMWLSKRTKGPTAKRHFEAEVGVQYVFDLSNNGFRFKEERKHELPVFRYVYTSGYLGTSRGNTAWDSDDYDDEWSRYYDRRSTAGSTAGAVRSTGDTTQTQSRQKTVEESTKERLNAMLEEAGIAPKLGEGIFFEVFQCDAYPNNSGKGKLTGFMQHKDEYIEVQAPGVNVSDFVDGREFVGKILSCYTMNYILHIIVGNAKPREVGTTIPVISTANLLENLEKMSSERSVVDEPLHRDEPEEPEITEEDEEEAVSAVTQDGTVVTKKEWESNGALNCCANCSSPIPWSDAEDATIERGNAFCADCNPNEHESDEYGYPKDSGSEASEYRFKCKCCGYLQHEDLESSEDKVCVICYNAGKHLPKVVLTKPAPEPAHPQRNILVLRRTLMNGMRVTKPLWEKMNECWCCKDRIPWEEAEAATFINGRVICIDCDDQLSKDKLPGRRR